jgi:hypothetical protein
MNDQPRSILAALARIRAAIARAFATSPRREGSESYGADTTLFGPGPENNSTQQRPAKPKTDGFWGAGGDSSYFADHEDGGKGPDRR